MSPSNTSWSVTIEQYEGMMGEPELVKAFPAFFPSHDDALLFWRGLSSRELPPLGDETEFYLIVLYSPEGHACRTKG